MAKQRVMLHAPVFLLTLVSVAFSVWILESLHRGLVLSTLSTPVVPVLSVALSSDPLRYMPHLLMSIDHVVDSILVHVGHENPDVVEEIERSVFAAIKANPKYLQGRVRFTRSSSNPGAAGGTNIGLRAIAENPSPNAAWGIIVNSDIRFHRGSLAKLAKHMARVLEQRPRLGLAFVHLHPLATWSAYAVTRKLVQRVGLQDENFFPAYFEDDDYAKRVRLAGFEAVVFADVTVGHGEQRDGRADYVSGSSLGMFAMSPHDNATAWQRSKRGWDANVQYMQLKWGARDMQPGASCKQADEINRCNVTYRSPFNSSVCALSYWRMSTRRKAWILSGKGALPGAREDFLPCR